MRSLLEKIGQMGGVVERFIADHGVKYRARKLPSGYTRGPARYCFMTSANLAMSDRRLTYVEGFGAMEELGNLPMHHAWCIDQKGRVVETTWEGGRGTSYIGIAIDTDMLTSELLRTKNYGVLYYRERANEKFMKLWTRVREAA